MRLSAPRIAPLEDAEMTDDQREALRPMSADGRRPLNIFRTLARAPKALTRFNEWGSYVLSRRNSLPPREREIVILRVGYLCKSGYEFTQHTRIGLNEGLSEAEIAAIKAGRVREQLVGRRRGADPRRRRTGAATTSSATRPGRRSASISTRSSAWTWCSPSASTPRSRCS